MTLRQIKLAKRKIAKPNYWKKRLRRMEQSEAWWTEQTYMYGQPHHTALYDLPTSAKQTVIYAKRADYYARKVAIEVILSLDWKDIRRIVKAANSILEYSDWQKRFPTEYMYYREVKRRLAQENNCEYDG